MVTPGSTKTFTVPCNAGEVATGGGFAASGGMVTAYENRPNPASGTPSGWYIAVQNVNGGGSANNRTVTAYAVCVPS